MKFKDYFCSQDFINTLSKAEFFLKDLDDESRINVIGYFIDISLKYYMLFSEHNEVPYNELNAFLETIIKNLPNIKFINTYIIDYNYYLNKYVLDVYANTLMKKLNIPKNYFQNKELADKIYEYVIDKILGTRYKFHSFNSIFYDSIKENGINPNITFTPQETLDKIDNLFLKHDFNGILGYQKINCEGKVSYSRKPSSVYKYGIASPEWFSFFTDTFYEGSDEYYTKNVLITNDYKNAKKNLTVLMNDRNFTAEEKETVLLFLEKNWKMYANNGALLAVIEEKRDIDDLIPFKYFIFEEKKSITCIQDIITECFDKLNDDCQTKKVIDTKNATYIKLPSFNKLIKKILSPKEENTKKRTKRIGGS